MSKSDGGKGSSPRPYSVTQQEYDARWDLIFGRDKPKKKRTKKNNLRKLKMSSTLIAIVGVVYAVVAADLLFKGNTGLGIAFVGYALGNVGLYMEAAK